MALDRAGWEDVLIAGGDDRLCGREAKYSSRREKKASCDGVSRCKGVGKRGTDLVFGREVGEHVDRDGMVWYGGGEWECTKQHVTTRQQKR